MKQILSLLTVITLLSFSSDFRASVLDKEASSIHWLGKKTTGQHEGDIKLQDGLLKLNGNEPARGEFTINMSSITCTDIKEADDNKQLVDHLKGEDFFNTDKFKMASLVATGFEKIPAKTKDEPNYKVTADLTIKGIKNQIQFPARIDVNDKDVKAVADITIDRTKWNIVFKSKTVFSTLGDKFIYDDINLKVNVVLHTR
jgi:polyisoprenoid-binding protein YceI